MAEKASVLTLVHETLVILGSPRVPLDIASALRNLREAEDLLNAEHVAASRAPQAEYPKPCGICDGVIQSTDDLDWHGYGNCRDIPDIVMADLNIAELLRDLQGHIAGGLGERLDKAVESLAASSPPESAPQPPREAFHCNSQILESTSVPTVTEQKHPGPMCPNCAAVMTVLGTCGFKEFGPHAKELCCNRPEWRFVKYQCPSCGSTPAPTAPKQPQTCFACGKSEGCTCAKFSPSGKAGT